MVFGPEGSDAFDFWSAACNLEASSNEGEFARATPSGRPPALLTFDFLFDFRSARRSLEVDPMRMRFDSIMKLDQKSKSQSAGWSARGSAGWSARGRPCSYELFLLPAHFKVARGRPKVKSVRKHGLERARAARRRCSCELSLVRARFKTAHGRPKVKSVTAFAPNTTAAPRRRLCELSLVRDRFEIGRKRRRKRGRKRGLERGRAALVVRTLPHASSLQGCAW